MKSILIALCVALPAAGQQLEPNTAGGSLTANGDGPLSYGTSTQIYTGQGLTVACGGNPWALYSLFVGGLVPTSLPVGGEHIDIDIASAICVVDGIGWGWPASWPASLGTLDGSGSSVWSVPISGSSSGIHFALQAAMADPAQPLGLNMSGAPHVQILGGLQLGTLQGDDMFQYFTPTAPFSAYGFSATQIGVSTNGWVTLSPTATYSDFDENATRFLAGTVGGAAPGSGPVIAAMWDDLDAGNGTPGQLVRVMQSATGSLIVQFTNMDEFPATPIGSFSVTLDNVADTITLDYTSFTGAMADGLIGISDGGSTLSAVGVEIDIANAGALVPYTSTNAIESWYQDFANGAYASPVDVSGLYITALGVGTGSWIIF